MKSTKAILMGAILSTITLTSYAAEQITQVTSDLTPISTISVFGQSSPDDVLMQLSEKANEIGATKFKVVHSESGQNSEKGTAIAYK